MPKLYLIPQPAPNAFATGPKPEPRFGGGYQGLLQLMNDDELEGVIAHELSHVRNYDILTSSIAATLAGAITWVAQMGRWGMIFGGWGGGRDNDREGGGGGLVALLMLFLAPLAALLLQLGISRQREYQADASGAKMVGHPYGLISALEKLGAYNKRIPTDIRSIDCGSVHRAATHCRASFLQLVQHPSSTRRPNRQASSHDDHALTYRSKPCLTEMQATTRIAGKVPRRKRCAQGFMSPLKRRPPEKPERCRETS